MVGGGTLRAGGAKVQGPMAVVHYCDCSLTSGTGGASGQFDYSPVSATRVTPMQHRATNLNKTYFKLPSQVIFNINIINQHLMRVDNCDMILNFEAGDCLEPSW